MINLIIIIHVPAHSLEEMDSIPKENSPVFILVNNNKKALKKAISKSKARPKVIELSKPIARAQRKGPSRNMQISSTFVAERSQPVTLLV